MSTRQQTTFVGATLSGAPVTVALVAVNVLVYLLMTVTGGSDSSINLYRWGAKYGPALADGEWWRLILPMFIHIGLLHLFTNSLGLLIFGSMAERLLGSTVYLAIYLVTGVLGNVASFIFSPALGAGASGAIFGVIGAFGVYLLLNRQLMGEMGRQALTTVIFIIVINIAIGFYTAGIDNAAHVGGLISGSLMALLVSPRQRVVMVPGFTVLDPPRMGIRIQRPSSLLLGMAIAIGIAIAVVGTTLRSQDYKYDDIYAACGYKFADFSDPKGFYPGACRFLN